MRYTLTLLCALLVGCSTAPNPVGPALPELDPWRPSLRVLMVTQDGSELHFTGCLNEGRDFDEWRFLVLLDTDEDEATGYYGWEFCIDGYGGVTDGTLPLRVCRRSGIEEQIAAVPFHASGQYFAFSVPLAALGDDGRMSWTYVAAGGGAAQSYHGELSGTVGWR